VSAPRSRVLVVDDSPTARRLLARSLAGETDIEVVGEAGDAAHAHQLVGESGPDVITLDLEMPGINGLDFLRRLMKERPTPVIVVSSHTPPGSMMALDALRAGAVDVILKPRGSVALAGLGAMLKERIRGLRQADVFVRAELLPRGTNGSVSIATQVPGDGIIAIGASAGGPQAIEALLTRLPVESPPILIVQHMPPTFVPLLVQRLDQSCSLRVVVAKGGETLSRGTVYLAPGDQHLLVDQQDGVLRLRTSHGARVHFHRPSVDVLFQSLARLRQVTIVGVLLTGMGQDGAEGMLALRGEGHETIAEDRRSCVVFGMPRAAIARGAARRVLPLDLIPAAILGCFEGSGLGDRSP
jgi:two-component system, chemotaxis family, protein-glutamate methylesterase/glutaminase